MKLDTVVVLDPGHGGADPGCIAMHGAWQEKHWTLDMAKLARSACLTRHSALSVELTRERDEGASLSMRARLARHLRADLVIAIHVDAYHDKTRRGTRVFWLSADARPYAEALMQAMPSELRRKGRTAQVPDAADWSRVVNVLQHHTLPAILVECGYSTNERDFAALRDPMVCDGIAAAIASTAHLAHITREAADVRATSTH